MGPWPTILSETGQNLNLPHSHTCFPEGLSNSTFTLIMHPRCYILLNQAALEHIQVNLILQMLVGEVHVLQNYKSWHTPTLAAAPALPWRSYG